MTVMSLIDSVVKRMLTAKFSHAVSSDGDEGLTPEAKLEAMMHAIVPRSVLEVSTLPAVRVPVLLDSRPSCSCRASGWSVCTRCCFGVLLQNVT
jgi:hypothetical protein